MQNKAVRTTTFQLPIALHSQLRQFCVLTETSMGEFIRIAIRDKIRELRKTNDVLQLS